MGYCDGVLEAVLRRAGDRTVSAVGVQVGAVHRVVPAAFQQSFEIAALGTLAEGARTEVTVVPVRGHCLDCRAGFPSADPAPACPSCGSLDVAVEGGQDVVLEWVAYGGPVADGAGERVPPHTHTHAPAHAAEGVG